MIVERFTASRAWRLAIAAPSVLALLGSSVLSGAAYAQAAPPGYPSTRSSAAPDCGPPADVIPAPRAVAALSPSEFQRTILTLHNDERARFGVEPLVWDPQLEANARAHAQKLGFDMRARGDWSPRLSDHANLPGPESENLVGGNGDARYTIAQAVGGWLNEGRWWRNEAFTGMSTACPGKAIGHYSLMVWRNIRSVGCAEMADGDRRVLVCRYSPKGNYVGQLAFPQGASSGWPLLGAIVPARATNAPPPVEDVQALTVAAFNGERSGLTPLVWNPNLAKLADALLNGAGGAYPPGVGGGNASGPGETFGSMVTGMVDGALQPFAKDPNVRGVGCATKVDAASVRSVWCLVGPAS
jgi:hypothetical protein